MKELFDALGGLARNAANSVQAAQAGATGQAGGAGIGGLLGSAALGGVFGMLLTSKSARNMAATAGKGALAVGGGAAVAALAWGLYKKWSEKPQAPATADGAVGAGTASTAPAVAAAGGAEQERQAGLLMKAMVFAARSDGHVDEQERESIRAVLETMQLGDVSRQMESLMTGPIDPASLAAEIRTPEEARDIYRLSCLVMEVDHFMERSYLDALAGALRLTKEEQARLEGEAAAYRAGARP